MIRGQHLIGKVLGSCVLERLLGYGGSSAVFLAHQHNPERKVAVKVFLPRTSMDIQLQRDFYRRFLREAEAASKLDHPVARYLAIAFCYGCNLGPSQTARSLSGVDRRDLSWVNQHHITEEKLDEAIVCYHRALELRPDNALTHDNLGTVYQLQEKYDEAKKYGISIGIPEYQVDFHPEVKEWER